MRKLLAAAVIISICSTAYASTWEKTPPNIREIMISRYISGFMAGYSYGINEGITSTMDEIKTTDNKVSPVKSVDVYDYCSNYIQGNFDKIYDATLARNSVPSNGTGYYIAEIDAFLKSNPTCRKMETSDLIDALVPVWFNLGSKKITYKDVAEGCVKPK